MLKAILVMNNRSTEKGGTMADEVRTVLDAQAVLAEGPRWDEREQVLYWVNIDEGQLHRFDPATGKDEFLQLDEKIGCAVLREQGGFAAALTSGFVLIDNMQGGITPLADPESDRPHQRFNDGRCDPRGRFVAGTLNPKKDALTGEIYTLDVDHSARRLIGNNWTTNGIAFSPDGSTMYYSDTPHHVIYKVGYDVETGCCVGEPEVFAEFPYGWGRPDGASVDSEGYYWAAMFAGARVVRISPEGEIVNTIAVPAKYVTMVTFGGPDLKTLYVTSARAPCSEQELKQYPQSGGIFAIDVDVAGLPEVRYQG